MSKITLEKCYHFAQIAAVVALLASLVHVGEQVRQHTAQLKMNAVQESARMQGEHYRLLASDPDLMALILRAQTSYDELEPVERLRAQAYVRSWIAGTEADFFASQQGAFGYGIKSLEVAWRKWLKLPLYRDTWLQDRDSHAPSFRTFMNGLLSSP